MLTLRPTDDLKDSGVSIPVPTMGVTIGGSPYALDDSATNLGTELALNFPEIAACYHRTPSATCSEDLVWDDQVVQYKFTASGTISTTRPDWIRVNNSAKELRWRPSIASSSVKKTNFEGGPHYIYLLYPATKNGVAHTYEDATGAVISPTEGFMV